jgi:signal transduction histidine kinase
VVEVALFVAGLSLLLWIAAAAQVRIGLKPLADLRADLARARRGVDGQLTGTYPTEVMPLVGDLNNLIGAQTGAVQRARARAGDLAHGLKTPLAVLDVEVRRLRERGEPDLADAISTELRAMTRVVERELARARIASGGFAAAVPLAPSIERIVRAVRRLPRGADLDWRVQCPPELVVSMDPTDLDELLGNALDNARKWANGVVSITARVDGQVDLSIDDDGPGIPPEVRDRAVQRGVRLDESTQGTGLGLAIMDDLMATYGGQMRLDTAPLGGLRVALRLPS